MKNILSLYKNLFISTLLNWEWSWNVEPNLKMNLSQAKDYVEKNKDFADFYERSSSMKLSLSNRLKYEDYKKALSLVNWDQQQVVVESNKTETIKLDKNLVKSAIDYNKRLPALNLFDVKEYFWVNNKNEIDENLISMIVSFQKSRWLKADWKVWEKTILEIIKARNSNWLKENLTKDDTSFQKSQSISIESVKKSFDDSTKKIVEKLNSWKDVSVEDKQNLQRAILLAEKQIWEINNASNNLDSSKTKLLNDFKKLLNETKQLTLVEISNNKSIKDKNEFQDWTYKEIKTKEVISSSKSDLLGVSRWEFNSSEFLNWLNANSKSSLEKILSKDNLSQTYQELLKLSPKSNWEIKFTDYLISENYKEYANKLKEIWYIKDWILDDKEASWVLSTIWDYVYNQENIQKLNDEQKLHLLFDFDRSWSLTIDKNFVVWELQSLNALKWLNSDWIDALMQNLWLNSIQDFSKEMSQNLFKSREKFQIALATLINSRVSVAELTQKKWVEKSFDNMLNKQNEITKTVNEEIENSQVLKNKLSTLEESQREEIKKILKLEAVAWVVNGSKIWAWASFDIKDYTKKIIDSVWFWVYDWKPWVMLSKEVYDWNWVNVKAWVLNVVIPFVAASYDFRLKNNFNWLFTKNIDSSYSPTVYLSGWINSVAWWLHFSKIDSTTKTWIDHMIEQTNKSIDLIKQDLLKSKDFNDSEYSKLSDDKASDMMIYNEFKNLADKFIWKPNHSQIVDVILKGYQEYYKNTLYNNAKWMKFSWAWVWVALIWWYLPLPYVTLNVDKISLDYKTVNDRLDGQREVTNKSIDASKLWLNYENLEWKNVYSLIDTWNIEFTSKNWEVEVLRKDWKVYFSWKEINNITFSEYFSQEKKVMQVVINWWNIWKNWEFINSKEVSINTSLIENIFQKNVLNSTLITQLNKEVLEKTINIRTNLFNIISKDALPSKDTPWITKLQDMIYKMSTNSWVTLQQAWEQFDVVINNPKFVNYAKLKNWVDSLNQLKQQISQPLSNAEKIMILQSIPACLMKKEALKIDKDDNVNVWKTIKEYDKRDKYFDSIFAKEAKDILPLIQEARSLWFNQNGKKTNYEFKKEHNGDIAFSWTEIKKSWKDTLMPYMWAFNIADAWVKEIPITKKSKDLVDRLPNEYLENLKNKINSNWVQISSIEDVKNMLKWQEINWVKLDYSQYFVKMWECLNDAIVLKDFKIIDNSKKWWIIELSSSSSANIWQESALKVWLAFSDTPEKKETNKPSQPETEPWIEEPQDPDSTPWIEVGNGWWNNTNIPVWEWDFN